MSLIFSPFLANDWKVFTLRVRVRVRVGVGEIRREESVSERQTESGRAE